MSIVHVNVIEATKKYIIIMLQYIVSIAILPGTVLGLYGSVRENIDQ